MVYVDRYVQKQISEGHTVDQDKLKKAYLTIILDTVDIYEQLAEKILNRTPKHILLLHENDIAALYIADLVNELRAKGWKIISPDKAYKDELSLTEPDTLLLNQGRIAAIGITKNYQGAVSSKWEKLESIEAFLNEQGVFKKISKSEAGP